MYSFKALTASTHEPAPAHQLSTCGRATFCLCCTANRFAMLHIERGQVRQWPANAVMARGPTEGHRSWGARVWVSSISIATHIGRLDACSNRCGCRCSCPGRLLLLGSCRLLLLLRLRRCAGLRAGRLQQAPQKEFAYVDFARLARVGLVRWPGNMLAAALQRATKALCDHDGIASLSRHAANACSSALHERGRPTAAFWAYGNAKLLSPAQSWGWTPAVPQAPSLLHAWLL